MRLTIQSLICIAFLFAPAGCTANRESCPAANEFRAGQLQAESDLRSGQAVYYVYRTVGEGETYPGTSIPMKDAGSDAVAPTRATFVAGYNSIVEAHAERNAGSSSVPSPVVDPH